MTIPKIIYIFKTRTFIIGGHDIICQYALSKALSFIKKSYPEFNFKLKHDISRNIQSEIQKGNIDIGLVVNPIAVPDLIIINLAVDEVAIWSSHNKSNYDTIICDQNLFQTQSILRKWKQPPKKMISTDSLELICQLVSCDLGYGILPQKVVQLSQLKLYRHNRLPFCKDQISLVFRPEFKKIVAAKLIIESFKNAF